MAINTPSLELSPNDLNKIVNEVTSMSPFKVVDFGLQLSISRVVIEGFEIRYRDMKQCLREILNERLKQEPPLTWPDMVTALRANSVGESRLARHIELKYMASSLPPSSVPLQLERAEVSLTTHLQQMPPSVPIQPSVAYPQSHSLQMHPSYHQQLLLAQPQNLYSQQPYCLPYPLPLQAPHNPILPQYHTQSHPALSYHPQDQYPPTLAPSNWATPSEFYVQARATANRPRLEPPANENYETKQNGSQAQVGDSKLISDPLTMFIEYTKMMYQKSAVETDTSVVKWPPTPSTVYINLALIDRKIVSGKSKAFKEVTEAMVCNGNVNVTKGPIEFGKICFSSNKDSLNTGSRNKRRHLILVEGAPGVGKSTFAWEYCRRWERGEIAQQYHLVLLLRLGNDRFNRAETLRDLIDHPMEGVPEAVCNKLIASHGLNVMFILEGFDELPESGRRDASLTMKLISGTLLPLATVLVTSRPWATERIRKKHEDLIYQHIDILGFSNTQISKYIESTIPQEEVSKFTAYIDRHPQIREGMYIPLNSATVVTEYQDSLDSGSDMPTTLTELYTALVKTLLIRYLHSCPECSVEYIQEFSDLPSAVYGKFLKLCAVAYNSIISAREQVQMIFSQRDLPANFDNLGLMDSVTELYASKGTVSSHNFLHLTFQEFFAAVHISNMSPVEQLEVFQEQSKHNNNMYHGRSSGGGFSSRLKMVTRFLAGLTKLKCFSKEALKFFGRIPAKHKDERYHLSCDVLIDSDLVNWMFETQSDDIMELLDQNVIEFCCSDDMLPVDYYSLGYCIAHSKCQWVLSLGTGEEEVEMLVAGVFTKPQSVCRVVGITWDIHNLAGPLSMLFSGLKTNLRQLSLRLPAPCDEITWPDLSKLQVLSLVVMSSPMKLDSLLSHLSLKSLTITRDENEGDGLLATEDLVALKNHVIKTSTLKHVSISDFDCSFSELLVLARAVHNHPTLQEKKLERLHYIKRLVGDDEARDLAQLQNEYHMESCIIWGNIVEVTGISDDGAVALAQALHQNSALWKLELCNNSISDVGALALAQVLHHNSNMTKLDLSNNSIGIAGAEALAHLFNHNSTLKDLNLSNNNVSNAGAVALAQTLHQNSSLKELNLSNSSISDTGAVALAQALHHNSTLEELNLSNNSISDDEVVALAQALHRNFILEGLDLSNNTISDDGAVALAQALHHNSTLRQLYLSDNTISDDGVIALAQSLHINSTLDGLYLNGNGGIGEKSTFQVVKALTVNKYCYLSLPRRCEEYAIQCPQYHAVNTENRIGFE